MKTYIENIRDSIESKTGKNLNELDYKQLPNGGKDCYSAFLAIGNINLVAGRFKTEAESKQIVESFINLPLP